jgi:hypothetical protein
MLNRDGLGYLFSPTEHRYCQSCLIGASRVQHDAALATLQYGICGMPPAGPTRWVDADDFGALIGQQQCRRRSSEILAEIDDADAVQRAGQLTTPRSRA